MHDLTLNGLPLLGPGVTTYVITGISGLDYPPLRVAIHDAAGEDGGYVSSVFYGSRSITIEGVILSPVTATFEAAKRALLSSLTVSRAQGISVPVELGMTTPGGLSLTTAVFPKGPPQLSITDPRQATFQIQLIAADPALYGSALTTGRISRQVQGGAVFPLTFPVTFSPASGGQGIIANAGDLDTWPTVYLRGALTSPRLYVVETGKTFKLNYTTTSASDVVKVDMKNKTIMLNGTTPLLQNRDLVERDWFSLAPGQSTVIFTTGAAGDTGTMEVTARSAYVGV